MGLFGPKNIKPLDDYLRQRPAEMLRKEAVAYVIPYIVFSSHDQRMIRIDHSKSCTYLRTDKYFTPKGTERIPRSYDDDDVTCQHFLELACEKGDPDAPFYLSLMYEYGMTDQALAVCGEQISKETVLKSRDPERAEEYMKLARERGSELSEEYTRHQTLAMLECADSGFNMDVLCGEDVFLSLMCRENNLASTCEMKLSWELAGFLGVLLAFYAGQEFPMSVPSFTVRLMELGTECHFSALEFAEKYTNLFRHLCWAPNGDIEKTWVRLMDRFFYLKDHGDPGAKYVAEKYNLTRS